MNNLTSTVLMMAMVVCALTLGRAYAQPVSDAAPKAKATDAGPYRTPGTPAASSEGENAGDAGAVAEPTPAEKAEEDPVGTAVDMVKDVRAGNWREAAVGALALLMFGLVRAREKTKWFKGDRGGAILVMALALAGTFSVAFASSAPMGWPLVLGAATAAWTAAGAVSWFKRMFWPKDKKPTPTPTE